MPAVIFVFLLSFGIAWAQAGQQSAAGPKAAPAPGAPQQPQKPKSPFEEVPEAKPAGQPKNAQPQQPAPPPKSPFEAVPEEKKEAPPAAPAAPKAAAPAPRQDIIERIEFRGNRRIPRDTLIGRLYSKVGDPFDPDQLRRDFMLIWNTGYFDDVRLEVEDGKLGKVVRFVVVERRMIRTIRYEGNKSATVSDILDRFKERKVGLAVETRYDPTKVARATEVLKELLGERGREYAKVTPEIHQIPPSSIELVFNIVEGPKVKVGKIEVVGNTVLSERAAIRAMKNLRPIGIPHSIFLEDLFSKTYDQSKLEEDKERLRNAYQEKGYFRATVGDQKITMRDVGGKGFKIPLFKPNKPGIRADIRVPVEEGKLYYVGKITFSDVKLFRTPEAVLRPYFQMQEGAIFDVSKLRKGMDNLKKVYGEFGYIDFVAEPNFEFREEEKPPKIDLSLSVDEGKQFFIRRINFSGNTTTRDKVIRRELLLDEGDMFNTRLWDLSILRLNQLGYFEPLKAEEAAQIDRDTRDGLVDLTLKVKERGKNSVGLTGGVSGFAGSFIGFNYSTNNFLGLGETLTLSTELGTIERSALFGFTEPYFMDKPIQTGFTIYTRSYRFDQAQQASILSGQNLIPYYNLLGSDNLQNFAQDSKGLTVFASYPLRHQFARVGLTYGFDNSRITPFSGASKQYFEFLNFQGVGGPNSLSGIKTSKIVPNYFYNTVNHPITPTAGKSLYISTEIASSLIGGNVNYLQPIVEAKYFRSVNHKRNVIGVHFLGSFLTGYGGKVAPPFTRYYIGGENDIRGFDFFEISPIAFIPDVTNVQVYNDNGNPRQQTIIVNGAEQKTPVTTQAPIYRLIFPGGDTRLVSNAEYRIPIFGPVTLAPFLDIGANRVLQKGQLTMNQSRIDELNGLFPQSAFVKRIQVVPQTEMIRASTGLELQVMLPVVNAPFRIYYAYNPLRLNSNLQPPIVADRSMFPNYVTYLNAIQLYGQAVPFTEPRKTFRFTISRTF
ncbi:MAG TPA: outer membrane protein assembly factor BamA [Bryobacterales bacterium]|nr:outer membrane protein assembly factor BamA [Bryobacterales bacterium]